MGSGGLSGDWATVAEAAEYLGVSPQTVRAWCKGGELRSVKLGHRTVRIAISSVEQYLERKAMSDRAMTKGVSVK